jgi:hypothetical protein
MTTDANRALPELLDVLLPGNALFPSASDVALAPSVMELAERDHADRLALDLLGERAASSELTPAAVGELQAAEPDAFRRLLELAYCAYYMSPPVLRVLEGEMGYPARPPQPTGYRIQDGFGLDRLNSR